MFDLEQAITEWSQSVKSCTWGAGEQRDELLDHLYTEIEQLKAQGLNDQQAFLKATERLGSAESLQTEYAKNDTLLGKVISAEKAQITAIANASGVSPKTAGIRIILSSLLFAAAMIATPWLIADKGTANFVVFAVLLPLWAAIYFSMSSVRQAAACEIKTLKHALRKVYTR